MPEEIIESIATQKENTNTLHLRSSEVSEIISQKPSFLVRWGITIFLFILIATIVTCWFIQYPDIVTTKATLNSLNAPKEVTSKIEGKLVKLFVTEGKQVQPMEILGFMESRANHTRIIQLSAYLDTISLLVNLYPEKLSTKSFNINNIETLGELQSQYQTYQQAFIIFQQYLAAGFYLKKKRMLQEDLAYLAKTYSNLLEQKKLQEEDLSLQQETFEVNEQLVKEKVISGLDYRNEKSKLINKKLTLPQISASLIGIESNVHEKQKEIAELDNQIVQQKNLFIEALNNLKAQVNEWMTKYILTAPVAGTIAFVSFIQENQLLSNNEIVCFVNPQNSSYYAAIYIPQNNFGKVAKGQTVTLKFSAYPFEQYGFVTGTLDFVSNIPTDSGYLAKVTLPTQLMTNYNKKLQFYQGLTAQGEIITQNMRLLERFFYQAKSNFSSH